MKPQITSNNDSIQPEDILQLEKVIGRPFPTQYRAFLLEHNGGQPEPDLIDIDGAPFSGTNVHVLHGIKARIVSSNILWHWENRNGWKEHQLLPIAHDAFGHAFGLVLDDDDYGHIYYFDSREIPPKPYFIAKDFDEFLSKIRELTPEELAEIEELAKGALVSIGSAITEPVDVSFPFTGSRPADAALANSAAGYETTPRGYVWHRHQDGETLQLVPKDVHKQTGDPAGYGLRWRSS